MRPARRGRVDALIQAVTAVRQLERVAEDTDRSDDARKRADRDVRVALDVMGRIADAMERDSVDDLRALTAAIRQLRADGRDPELPDSVRDDCRQDAAVASRIICLLTGSAPAGGPVAVRQAHRLAGRPPRPGPRA
jgi:hypothetical protein